MRKIYLLLIVLIGMLSCSQDDSIFDGTDPHVSTKSAGDGAYDVLGYGYDITGDYLNPLSVKNPVLDIAKYEIDYKSRIVFGTSSWGYDRFYYGASSLSYLKDITKETNVKLELNIVGDSITPFTGNISANPSFKSEYSHSSKYSFASVDAVRNKKYIRFNDEIGRLSNYLTKDFIEDLDRLTPERIVDKYGTHVLTNFIIGGRYKLMFRSVIDQSIDATTRKMAVASGLKATLDKIGFNLNSDRTITTNESLTKENQYKELYVYVYGGSGSNLKYDLEKGYPTSVDIQGWENSVKSDNFCLTDIDWKETYLIYDFISDPVKKEKVKAAVKQHVENKQLRMLEIQPLYLFTIMVGRKELHHLTHWPNARDVENPEKRLGINAYYFVNERPNTTMLRSYLDRPNGDRYTTTIEFINGEFFRKDRNKRDIGYINIFPLEGMVPLYEYSCNKYRDHYTTTDPTIATSSKDWSFIRIAGYVYPAN